MSESRAPHGLPGAGRHGWRLGLLLLLGLALRIRLLDRVLDYDEQFSWLLAQQPLATLLEATHGDVHPPLHYLILSAWGALFGYSEISMRLPSAIAGLCVIALVYYLGRRLELGDDVTFVAALITAVSPFQVFFSQQARMYEVEALAFGLAVAGLMGRRRWLLVGGSVATLYLHNSAALFVAVLFLTGLWWRTDRRAHVVDGLLVALAFLPGLPRLLHQTGGLSGGYWISREAWLGLPDLIHTFAALVFDWSTGPLGFVLVTVGVLLLLVLIDRGLHDASREWRLLACLSLVPMLVLALVSIAWRPVLLYRTVSPSAPALYLLLVSSAARGPWRRGILSLAVALALAVTLHTQFVRPVERFAPIYIDALQPGDGVYHFRPGSYVSYLYGAAEQDVSHVAAPAGTGLHGGSLSAETATALGLEQRDLSEVLCRAPAWTLLWIEGEGVEHPALRRYFQEVRRRYDPRLIRIETTPGPVRATESLYRLESARFCPSSGVSAPGSKNSNFHLVSGTFPTYMSRRTTGG